MMLIYFVLIVCALLADAKAEKLIPRIIKGNDALIETYPYQVSLDYDAGHLCGGSIISNHYALTAAHCSNLVPDMDKLFVRAGSSFPGKGGTLHKVVKLTGHKGFDINEYGSPVHDIAIVEVKEPFQYDGTCQPIELFKTNETATPGAEAVVTGYGLMADKKPAEQLQAVVLTIVSKQACGKVHDFLPESQICALGESGRGSCTGDSGGPIAIDARLAGLVSWGKEGCNTEYPSVYTEVADYHDWINENVQF